MTMQQRACVTARSVVILAFLIISNADATSSIPVPTKCSKANEYFDISSLSCESCPSYQNTTKVPNISRTGFMMNANTCICGPGHKIKDESASLNCDRIWPGVCDSQQCERCPANFAATRDRSTCLECGATTLGRNATSLECACADGYRLSEVNNNGEFLAHKVCTACPSNTKTEQGSYDCVQCPHDQMILIHGECKCNSGGGYVDAGLKSVGTTTCLRSDDFNTINSKFPLNDASKVSFSATGESSTVVDSGIFRHYFPISATQCYFYTGPEQGPACQTLANLCVLNILLPISKACMAFTEIKGKRTSLSHQVKGWSTSLPFIKYDGGAKNVLKDVAINTEFTFDSTMSYYLASYSLNGTFLGMEELHSQLMYCNNAFNPHGPSRDTRWLQFGSSYSENYLCDLDTMLEKHELKFYELFFSYGTSSSKKVMFPVPVRFLNYDDGNENKLNRNTKPEEEEDDVLGHRFVLWDATSGKQDGGKTPAVVRYASRLHLHVSLRESSSNLIYPPVLSIEYTDITTPLTGSVALSFVAEYASDTDAFWKVATAFFSIMCVVSGFLIIIRFFNWQRRSTRGNDTIADMASIMALLTFTTSTLAYGIFWLMFILAQYYFIFFKLQDKVFLMLPEDNQEYSSHNEYYPFKTLLLIAFLFQFFYILAKIYQQTSVEIFFVDWEKSRAKLLDSDSVSSVDAPVSAWRSILVANEWNEIQTIRRTSLEFTLIFLAFILVGCDYQYLSTPQPDGNDLRPGPSNLYLRFANSSFWILLLSYGQMLLNWAFTERFFTEPKASEFVDMCTMAKISCFLLVEKYHGYYLHCRSPYPFADGTMVEIADQLKQEEAGLMSGRGLHGGPPDVQTFEVYITQNWRRSYDKIYASLLSSRNTRTAHKTGRLGSVHGAAAMHPKNRRCAPPTKLVKAGKKLNGFLKAFVENLDEDHRWKMQTNQRWLNQFLQIPPEMTSKKCSILLPDKKFDFTKVLFLGIEHQLILFNVLCFCIFELWTDDAIVAVLLTYLIERFLVILRNRWGHQNLAEKTLVDERFLI